MSLTTRGEIYNVPNSGWKSPQWQWGSAIGTGHDCAAICRQRYATRAARQELIQQLLLLNENQDNDVSPEKRQQRLPTNFEEVKLVLALAWQRGRWDGSDGGPGGYGDVLMHMAQARRYESLDQDDEEVTSRQLVQDMASRFELLSPTPEETERMKSVVADDDYDRARRQCSGLVLEAMGFVENGL